MLSETTRYIIHNPFNNHQPPTSNHIKSIQNALKQSVPRFCRGTQGTWFLMEFILVLDFRLPWHPPSQNTIKITNTHTLISKHHNILHQIYCNPKTKQFFLLAWGTDHLSGVSKINVIWQAEVKIWPINYHHPTASTFNFQVHPSKCLPPISSIQVSYRPPSNPITLMSTQGSIYIAMNKGNVYNILHRNSNETVWQKCYPRLHATSSTTHSTTTNHQRPTI